MPQSPSSTSPPGRLVPDALGGSHLRHNDGGVGGTIAANGSVNCPPAPKKCGPSFAAVVSSSSAGARTKSPLSVSSTPSIPTQPWRKHNSPPRPSSLGFTPLGDNTSNSKNNFFHNSSFSIGNGVATNFSTQSTLASVSSQDSSPSGTHNMSHGNGAQDSGDDDIENDQEDTESSDVEIYLNSADSQGNLEARTSGVATSSSNFSKTAPNSNYVHLHSRSQSPYSPQHTATEAGQMTVCVASSQGVFDLAQTRQEKCVPEAPSVLGTYGNGNGYVFAQAYGLGVAATTSISNDAGSKISMSAMQHAIATPDAVQLPQPQHPQKTLFAQQQANAPQSPYCGLSRDHTPLPKAPLHHNILSSNDSHQTPFAQPPSPNSAIDLSNLSISSGPSLLGNALTMKPSKEIGVTAANAGTHQSQMGIMSVSPDGSLQPVNNAGFPSSASEPILNGSSDAVVDNPNSSSLTGNGNFDSGPSVKIPNVYINGLPPHFPEDELFNLCHEFGPIRSVRTFTRHVRDSESGYGFVLFENLEDAERCIVSLRRFRNLHPTFSKQIHKIPGTNYSVGPSTSAPWNVSTTGDTTGKASFKAKMESLHDPTSTNLYMEGLPLDITAAELIALVSPYRIVSARGFPTKLSKPPRAIVFVRLETRVGAEEIIERLHGRMMDDGERLSVRFADSGEQKELRRTERAVQDGDTSPSRLTIAQASLLNLRGQGLRSDGKTTPGHPVVGASLTPSSSNGRGFATSVSAPDFSSNTPPSQFRPGHSNSNVPLIGNGALRTGNGLEVDYSLAPMGLRSTSPYHRESYQQDQQYSIAQPSLGRFNGLGQRSSSGDPSTSQLDNLRTNATPYVVGGRTGYGDGFTLEEDLFAQSRNMRLRTNQIHGASFGHQRHHLPVSHSLDSFNQLQGHARPSPAYTRSGYTPAEEYIMRLHAENAALAQSQQHQQAPDPLQFVPQQVERGRPARLDMSRQRPMGGEDANIAVGMRAYRAQASLMSPSGVNSSGSLNSMPSLSSLDGLRVGTGAFGQPTNGMVMTEDEFHASRSTRNILTNVQTSSGLGSYQAGQRLMPISPPLSISYHQNQGGSSPSSGVETSAQSLASPNPNDTVISAYHQHGSIAHMRSTTLPQQKPSVVGNNVKGHHQHSSMSMPNKNLGTPQHASVARLGGLGSSMESSTGTIYETEGQDEKQMSEEDGTRAGTSLTSSTASGVHSAAVNPGSSVSLKTHYSSTVFGDVDPSSTSPLSPSSSLISPTLTCGSQTPSTLSPATPFFGSFNHNVENFDKSIGEQQRGGFRSGSC